MTSIFGAGPECGVNLDGTSRVDSVLSVGESVVIPQGFLDVAGSTVTSDTVEAECIRPTLESNACLQLVQERIRTVTASITFLWHLQISLNKRTRLHQCSFHSRNVQRKLQRNRLQQRRHSAYNSSDRAPTPAPTKAPVVAPTTESPTAAPMVDLVEVVPTDAPISDAPTKSPTASPITTESPSASPITDAPTQSQSVQSPTPVEVVPTTEVPTVTEERESEQETNAPEEAEPTTNPDIPVTNRTTTRVPSAMPKAKTTTRR